MVLVDMEWSDEQENLCIGPVLSSQCKPGSPELAQSIDSTADQHPVDRSTAPPTDNLSIEPTDNTTDSTA